MKAKWFSPVLLMSFVGLFLVSATSTAVFANPGDTEQIQLAQKDPPPPPKPVSLKDPEAEVKIPFLNCPHCGKQIPSHRGKGHKARPQLGAVKTRHECMVPGHRGMQGHPGMQGRKMGRGARHDKMGRRGDGRPGQIARLLRHADVLGLTEDQQAKLKELKFSAEKEMIDLKAAMQKEQLELKQLMTAEDLNARSIKRQLEAVALAQTNLKFRKISLRIEARDILTGEQRELIKEKLHGLKGAHLMGHRGRDCGEMMCPPGCCPGPGTPPEKIMHLEEE
jgi:Spy/CpxP family protein refolding chaperone